MLHRPRPLILVAVAAVAVLPACAGDDDDEAQPTVPAETSAFADGVECPPEDGTGERVTSFDQVPPMCIDSTATYVAEVETNKGRFTIDLDAEQAPATVNNFVVLARYGFYDGVDCHRIIPGFMAQCGDPTGTGTGGPGYRFADELPEPGQYVRGAVAMANSGPDTNGSQFFVVTGDGAANLPPDYSLFGTVTGGLDSTLDDIDASGNPDPRANGMPPREPVVIEQVTITES